MLTPEQYGGLGGVVSSKFIPRAAMYSQSNPLRAVHKKRPPLPYHAESPKAWLCHPIWLWRVLFNRIERIAPDRFAMRLQHGWAAKRPRLISAPKATGQLPGKVTLTLATTSAPGWRHSEAPLVPMQKQWSSRVLIPLNTVLMLA